MNTEQKRDGFKGEQMIVLPTEAFQPFIENPLVRRMYLTDVGYFPKALHSRKIFPEQFSTEKLVGIVRFSIPDMYWINFSMDENCICVS